MIARAALAALSVFAIAVLTVVVFAHHDKALVKAASRWGVSWHYTNSIFSPVRDVWFNAIRIGYQPNYITVDSARRHFHSLVVGKIAEHSNFRIAADCAPYIRIEGTLIQERVRVSEFYRRRLALMEYFQSYGRNTPGVNKSAIDKKFSISSALPPFIMGGREMGSISSVTNFVSFDKGAQFLNLSGTRNVRLLSSSLGKNPRIDCLLRHCIGEFFCCVFESLRIFALSLRGVSQVPGRNGEIMSINTAGMHFSKLSAKNTPLQNPDASNNDGKNRHPDSGSSGFPGIPFIGLFLLATGIALLKISFWLFDDPSPPKWASLVGYLAGAGAVIAIGQGAILGLNIF